MLLSKETFHRFNRILLLSIIMLSFLLPFIEVTMQKMPEMTVFFLLLEEAMETYETQHPDVLAETPNRFPWNTLIFSVYVSGTLFFLLRHAWSIGRMLCLLRTCRKEEREDGITLYIHQAKVAPFSWMKLMAISEEDLEKHSEAILAHERAHIRNHHSWDLLLAQACVFLQWFNPAAWFLKKELQTIHEYEAD
jgi:Zn-dependent protease with chaperone function